MAIKKVLIDRANRLYQMPPGLFDFARADRERLLLKRPELIDLGTFNWPVAFGDDDRLSRSSLIPASEESLNNLKEEIAAWYQRVHHRKLVPGKEIFVGGSLTSLIQLIAFTFLDSGEVAFIPELGIPAYRRAVLTFGGEPITYPLNAATEWKPTLERLQTRLGRIARLLYLNVPHNPTGSLMSEKEMAEMAWLAGKANILVVNDAAYQAISDHVAPSLPAVEGGKRVGAEIHSFSYLFGLPRLPFGFVIAGRNVISALRTAAKSRPQWIPQCFVELAMDKVGGFPAESLVEARKLFHRSSAEAHQLCEKLSLQPCGLNTVPFLWCKLERRSSSVAAARILYRRHRILTAPGTGFGNSGQGYLRFSHTAGPEAFHQATDRARQRINLREREDRD